MEAAFETQPLGACKAIKSHGSNIMTRSIISRDRIAQSDKKPQPVFPHMNYGSPRFFSLITSGEEVVSLVRGITGSEIRKTARSASVTDRTPSGSKISLT